ncbi:fas apoptotic inhibitory molecule 1 [Trichonephila clavata]|uniref:Fas apoptotic inhibitory molecule 1 n=1 Tax=Trichonephila clavata TaxID=2740835 RepID=A0A8X6ID07_TRICU|nr:fas apoptotic inhibitory molecule 1 [Trichonephila clavata]
MRIFPQRQSLILVCFVNMSQVVGVWDITLNGQKHLIEFEHGTTSGRRIVRVDGKEVLKREWLFKLVGHENFKLGNNNCSIVIYPAKGLSFEYSLIVNGKQYKKFKENQSKILKTWIVDVDNEPTRIVLEKDTLDVWVNGEKMETAGEFVEEGTETHFALGPYNAYIKAVSSGNKREGIIHSLIVGDAIIPESND